MKRSQILTLLISGSLVGISLLIWARSILAEPSDFTTCQTSTSTTSPRYIQMGSTTTSVCDTRGADLATITAHAVASSSATLYGFLIEQSFDGVVWFSTNHPIVNAQVFSQVPQFLEYSATSTPRFVVASSSPIILWNPLAVYVSGNTPTSPSPAIPRLASTTMPSIIVPIVGNQIRATAFIAPNGDPIDDRRNGSIWMQVILKREQTSR